MTIAGILKKNARIESGKIAFEGKGAAFSDREGIARHTGKEISMIFQEPMTALNPTLRIGRQVEKHFCCMKDVPERKKERAFQALRDVKIKRYEVSL